jgi:hypothetical protein
VERGAGTLRPLARRRRLLRVLGRVRFGVPVPEDREQAGPDAEHEQDSGTTEDGIDADEIGDATPDERA